MKFIIIFFTFLYLFANQNISILLDWKYQFEFAGYIAAKEKGFYKEAGVDVELIEYNNNDIIEDVLSGKYDFGIYDNNLIDAKIKGKPVKLIASIFKRSALVLLVKPNIHKLKDLENKTLMIANKDKKTFENFLKENHVDISKIKFIPTNYSIKPFIKNKVDSFSAFITDEIYLLEQKGVKFKIINPSDYNFLMYQGEFFTSANFANKNPILVDRIKKATIKGWEYALNHKKELVDIIYEKYSKRKSKEALLDEAYKIETIIQRKIYPIGFIDKPLLKSQFLYVSKKLNIPINLKKEVNEYIFEFDNPLNLDKKYLPIIYLYNFYLHYQTLISITLVFVVILLIIFYFYIKVKKQKDYIQTLFDKAPIAYVLMEMESRKIVKVNDYAYILFKYNKDDKVLGINSKPFHKNEESYYKFQEKIENYISTHKTIDGFDLNWQFRKKDGTIFWTNVKAIEYDKDKILWVLNDIDELMKTQEKLNKQIQETKRAMKVKEEFLANMSHEIRTPLNAILGFVEIIEKKEIDEENKKYLKIIEKSSKHLLTIINDILDFSKIESGKLIIEKIEFNPKEEFETLIALFESKAKEKNINLRISFEGLKYFIISDPTRIKQVISNLISNAIKFTPENKNVYCNINYNSHTEKLYVEVIDEGIGIEKDKLNLIFKAFSQADSSTTRKYGGTGLGLTISKKLVELLGGELKVSSELNVGSKFYFSIPAKKTKKIEEKVVNKETKMQDIKFCGKVLVVEDNKANQIFLKVVLNTLGINDIDVANDGLEAIQKVKEKKYDLILMDENMPNMNGIEASKKIKELGITTPIIAVTANALSGDKERFLKVMEDYISKPIDKEKLIKILEKYLNKKDKND